MEKILLVQGANMNFLGRRQPEIYGTTTAAELDAILLAHAGANRYQLDIFYSNIEGEAIDRLYRAADEGVQGLVMNPAGFNHAGYALRDCILALMTGTDEQRELVQEAVNRWWGPLMQFHGHPIPAGEDPMYRWRIKSQANEEARQQFLDGYVPQIWELGLTVPDPKLRKRDDGVWEFTEPDWDELMHVVTGHGPLTEERLGFRRVTREETAWVRDVVLACNDFLVSLNRDFEIIVVDDGSHDDTVQIARTLDRTIVHVHDANRGYGGALQSGIQSATKDLIFYTDGDAQYDPAEMDVLWSRLAPDVDMVNGYKISRSDPFHRIVIGRVYHHMVSVLFGLNVSDVDCDFRLLRREIFEKVRLEKTSGVICLEMMKKIEDAGFAIVEVPVHHYHRAHGRSQFFNFSRVFRTAVDVLKLWYTLVVRHAHRREGAQDTKIKAETRAL